MKTKKLTILALSLILFSSCLNFHRVKGNYELVEQKRKVGETIHGISTGGDFIIIVADDTAKSVIVEAESNLLNYISTTVNNGNLKIRYKYRYRIINHEPVKIHIKGYNISSLDLSGSGFIICNQKITESCSINLSGSGNVECTDISCDDLKINISGSGKINANVSTNNIEADISGSGIISLSGNTDYSKINISGSGEFRTLDMIQKISDINLSGSGKVYVNVIEEILADISGSGEIHYEGDPVITKNISGSGEIIKE